MLLEEFLKPMGLTQSAFAVMLGVSFPRLNELIRGRRGMTPNTALRLGRVLGVSADFWLELQVDWDLWHAIHGRDMEEILRLEPIVPSPRPGAHASARKRAGGGKAQKQLRAVRRC